MCKMRPGTSREAFRTPPRFCRGRRASQPPDSLVEGHFALPPPWPASRAASQPDVGAAKGVRVQGGVAEGEVREGAGCGEVGVGGSLSMAYGAPQSTTNRRSSLFLFAASFVFLLFVSLEAAALLLAWLFFFEPRFCSMFCMRAASLSNFC